MKPYFKYTLAAILASGAALAGYYLHIVTAPGNGGIQFIEPTREYATLQALLQDPALRNKVVYVDFWHTGCAPCLAEFALLPKLKAQVKDPAVTYLYLGKDRSVPGEKFRWKKMVAEKRVTGYHYFISNAQFYAFWQEAVTDKTIPPQFPHHLLVNRQGQIVDGNAPGPASPQLIALLQKELHQ